MGTSNISDLARELHTLSRLASDEPGKRIWVRDEQLADWLGCIGSLSEPAAEADEVSRDLRTIAARLRGEDDRPWSPTSCFFEQVADAYDALRAQLAQARARTEELETLAHVASAAEHVAKLVDRAEKSEAKLEAAAPLFEAAHRIDSGVGYDAVCGDAAYAWARSKHGQDWKKGK